MPHQVCPREIPKQFLILEPIQDLLSRPHPLQLKPSTALALPSLGFELFQQMFQERMLRTIGAIMQVKFQVVVIMSIIPMMFLVITRSFVRQKMVLEIWSPERSPWMYIRLVFVYFTQFLSTCINDAQYFPPFNCFYKLKWINATVAERYIKVELIIHPSMSQIVIDLYC